MGGYKWRLINKIDKIYPNIRLLIVGVGFGIILSGTICSWDTTPVSFKVLFCIALLVSIGFAINFSVLPHKEYTNNEQDNTYSQRH